jgi:hypothetical protein
MSDKVLAATLNRARIRDPLGKTWNAGSVKSFRGKHGIPVFSERRKEQQGWLTQAEAATYPRPNSFASVDCPYPPCAVTSPTVDSKSPAGWLSVPRNDSSRRVG